MVVAIDIGGTKTLVATFVHNGDLRFEKRFQTAPDFEAFIADLEHVLSHIKPGPTDSICVAAPGLIDSEQGIILHTPNLQWRNVAIKKMLEDQYGSKVYLQNDANLAALGAVHVLPETPDLALYISIGTGIGGGIITHGKLDAAFSNTEPGHMIFETAAGLQEWEDFASGRAITKKFGVLAKDITSDDQWHQIAQNIAVGLRVLIPAIQPDIVLIGGGVGSQLPRFKQPLKQLLHEQLPHFLHLPPIVQAKDPEKAVLYGCYYYAVDSTKLSNLTV
jgi:glucokinase